MEFTSPDLHSLLFGKALIDNTITMWMRHLKIEYPHANSNGEAISWNYLPAHLPVRICIYLFRHPFSTTCVNILQF